MNCQTGHKVQSEEEWRTAHVPHGEPSREYPEPQPPSYKILNLVCPCGARLVMLDKGQV